MLGEAPPDEDVVRAVPAETADELVLELESVVVLVVVVVAEPVVVPVVEPVLVPVPVESAAHDESVPDAAAVDGVVAVAVLPVSVLVDVVVVVVVSALGAVAAVIGVVPAAVPVAGQAVLVLVPGLPGVVVEPASTVESVWLWVRPATTVGAGLAFVAFSAFVVLVAFVSTIVPCLAVVLADCFWAAVVAVLAAAGLCRWVTAAGCWSILV